MSNAFRGYKPESEARSEEIEGTTYIALMPSQILKRNLYEDKHVLAKTIYHMSSFQLNCVVYYKLVNNKKKKGVTTSNTVTSKHDLFEYHEQQLIVQIKGQPTAE